ncbi:MAG TPA: sugar transporter [Gammaproteobacteria bacterium]|nr:sugar transporter [Gammaproteobacteria bacterium]
MRIILDGWLYLIVLALSTSAFAGDQGTYAVQPGDLLKIHVWDEPDLNLETLVRPDGYITLPLAGEISAAGSTPAQITNLIETRLTTLIPDPVVTVAVLDSAGYTAYVLGQVNRPGGFTMQRPLDVMQALSIAGGMTPFAKTAKIRILRRDQNGQQAIGFDYGEVAAGKKLEQNLLLQPGDVVVVP